MRLSDSSQTDMDTELTALITQASAAIKRYTQREFAPQTAAGVARKFRYYGGGALWFSSEGAYDAAAVTAVSIDTETSSPLALTVDEDYFLFPRNAPNGVYEGMELRNMSPQGRHSGVDYRPWRQVTVTGTWGFASVPDDVELAAQMQVAYLYRQHSSVPGRDLSGEGERFGPMAWAPGVVQLLAPYRIYGTGGRV
jgi:hypothetical protein